MARVPEVGSFEEYARFTFELWTGLDTKYQFYVNRWRRTMEFLRDQHWAVLKEYSREVLPKWQRFPIQNFTLAFYNDYLTDYLKSEVRFSAVPASNDSHDVDSADLSEQLLKYLWDRLNLDRKRIDLGAWIIATGCGALRVYWDTNTGNMVPLGIPTPDGGFTPIDPETLQPMEGEPVMVDAGEIGLEVISPQFVRWAENPQHGVMVGLLLSYEEASAFYGEDVADTLTYSDGHHGIAADLNQIEQPGVSSVVEERTLVIQHYLPKSKANPKGLWWTAAQGGNMMIHPAWPLPAGIIPVVSFRWIPIPGERHLGMSPLYGITFQNKVYEEITAKLLEWYEKAKPKILLTSGGGVNPGQITDEPYQELIVNEGAEPDTMNVEDAPAGLFRLQQLVENAMTITSGRTFEEQDQIPEGVATQRVRAPSEFKASRAVTLGHISSKASWREVGEALLHIVGTFYNEERVVAVQGPDHVFMWREFTGDNLLRDGNLAATIHVDDIPLVPHSRQNLRDSVIALLQTQAGAILFAGPDGQLDMDRINAALQATGLDTNMNVVDPDVLEARNEQVAFQNLQEGQDPPKLESWQNDMAHWTEHTKIVKSQRFRSWSQHARAAFLEHLAETEERLNASAQAEADAMIEQEQKLRQVREQEELRADVMREWAQSLIGLVAESTGLEMQDIMGLLERPGDKSKED